MSHKDKTIFSNNQMPMGHFFFSRLSSQLFHKVKTKFSFCQIYIVKRFGDVRHFSRKL